MCGTAEVTSCTRRFHLDIIDEDGLVRFSSQRVVHGCRCARRQVVFQSDIDVFPAVNCASRPAIYRR